MDVYAQGATAASPAREPRPLESLSLAVQRINTAQVQIGRFIDRWHGDSPKEQPSGDAGAAQTVTTPHAVNLQRLFDALDRLEIRTAALDQIG